MAPAKMAVLIKLELFAGSAPAISTQMSAMVAKSNSEQPPRRPSRPSSRLAELTVPTRMNIITGM